MADYTPIYPNADKCKTLTTELESVDATSTHYDAVLLIAYENTDNKIESRLTKNNVPIPDTAPAELIEIGTLYAVAFMYNDYYSNEDKSSPVAKTYNDEADSRLQDYIESYLDGHSELDEDLPVSVATYIEN